MSKTEFMVLIGTMWLAPHASKTYGLVAGTMLIVLALAIDVGAFA